MKMNDGASADVTVGNVSSGGRTGVVLKVDGERHVMSAGEACQMLEVLYGCEEKAVVLCEPPLVLLHSFEWRHSFECGAAYMLYRAEDNNPDGLLAVIRTYEAVWLKLKLEQAVSACD